METLSSDTTQAMHDVGQAVSNAANSAMVAGSEMASSATAQVKTFAAKSKEWRGITPLAPWRVHSLSGC